MIEKQNQTLQGYELPVSALAAAVTHAGVKDVRFYLNGVYLDFPRGRIVSTDGHRLFCGAIPAANCTPVIVERALVERVLKVNKGLRKFERERAAVTVSVATRPHPDGEPQRIVELNHAAASVRFEAPTIDGQFPAYERIIPKPNGEAGSYNTLYLLEAATALHKYAGDTQRDQYLMVHQQNGDKGPCLCTLPSVTALVIVMPARAPEPAVDDLDWFTAKPETLEVPA